MGELLALRVADVRPGEAPVVRVEQSLRRDGSFATPKTVRARRTVALRCLLIYGTPVPGYTSPAEATELATRIFTPILNAFAAADAEQPLTRSLTFWTRVHGVISLEVAGHFRGMPFDPAQLFNSEVESALTSL